MPKKLPKFFRDPVHDIIRVDQPFILDLIDTPAFQRLRHIRQLGLASIVYPGAEHSRFVHMLGTYHLSRRVLRQLNDSGSEEYFDERQRNLVMVAALLHDIGHGPFSHLFEKVFADLGQSSSTNHEEWTERIIKEDPDIRKTLDSIDKDFCDDLCDIYGHTYKPFYVWTIVSSQLDVDRFDYLLRDSHMTGAKYGVFDREWLLRIMTMEDVESTIALAGQAEGSIKIPSVVIDARRGMNALEQHILGRHFMYRNVYYHKAIRAAEALMRMIIKRAASLAQDDKLTTNPAFKALAKGNEITIEQYMTLNDFLFFSWIREWAVTSDDKTLADLCRRFVARQIFGTIIDPGLPDTVKIHEKLRDLIKKAGLEEEYYFLYDSPTDMAYKDLLYTFEREKTAEEIFYLDQDSHKAMPLGAYDKGVLAAAKNVLLYKEFRFHVPKEIAEEYKKL